MTQLYPIPLRKLLVSHPAHFISLGFGSGLSSKAPGTCGSLVAVPFLPYFWTLSPAIAIFLICIGFGFGVWCTGKTAQAMMTDDPGAIVWDEVIGMLITAFPVIAVKNWTALELSTSVYTVAYHSLVVFVLFRFIDILKPFPVAWADRKYHGGFGIMFDDFLAGVLASFIFVLFLFLI